MRIDVGYGLASLTFDVDGQLKGQICHFVMNWRFDLEGQGQGQRSVVHRMHITMGYDFSYKYKVARCNSFCVMR